MCRLVRHPVLGLHSDLGKSDWDLVFQVFNTLRRKGMWKELKDYAEETLFPSNTSQAQDLPPPKSLSLEEASIQDMNLWRMYTESVINLGQFDSLPKEMIVEDEKDAAATRGSAIARCEFARARNLDDHTLKGCSAALRTTSQTWFSDMKPFLEKASLEDRARLKAEVQEMVSSNTLGYLIVL